jgi:Leucine-rich repeat (LRR) protein
MINNTCQSRTNCVQITQGLQQLGTTSDGSSAAYLGLKINRTTMSHCDDLPSYPALQVVDLRDNQLTCVRSLGALANLTDLDASRNHLSQLLQVDQPLRNLRRVSYEGNSLQMLPDLSAHSRLQAMDLGSNQLSSLVGLRPLAMLAVLKVPRNALRSCRGLEGGARQIAGTACFSA